MYAILPMLLSFFLGACPDPSTAPTPPMGATGPEGAAAPPGGMANPSGEPPPSGGPPPPIGFSVNPGEGSLLSGTIQYKGSKSGKVRLDFLKVVENNPPMLAHTLELTALGEWSVEAPKDFGDVRIVGFLDQTGDGPSRDDPAMAWPDVVKIAQTPVSGLDMVLSDNPDLGALTPGPGPGAGSPPDGQGGGPGGPPPGGAPAGAPPAGGPPPGEGAAGAPPAGAPPAGAPPAGAPPAGAPPAGAGAPPAGAAPGAATK